MGGSTSSAGDVWYEAPDWKMHEIRTPGNYVPNAGYSDSFCNFGYDVNGDGWVDQICIGFPGADFHWYENPKNAPGHWKEHLIWHSACNETPNFLDLTGDGKRQLILGSQPEDQMGYLPIPPAGEAYSKWTFYPVSVPGDPKKQGMDNGSNRFYHGLGVGDFNQDGRNDVIIRDGWWEAPEDRAQEPVDLSSLKDGADRQELGHRVREHLRGRPRPRRRHGLDQQLGPRLRRLVVGEHRRQDVPAARD